MHSAPKGDDNMFNWLIGAIVWLWDHTVVWFKDDLDEELITHEPASAGRRGGNDSSWIHDQHRD